MPSAEVDVDAELVAGLVADQFPALADRAVSLHANGWDNFTFRLGSDLIARLPRRELAARLVENEAEWLPRLAPLLPLPVPAARHLGQPGRGYPWRWVIAPWIDGAPLVSAGIVDLDVAAHDLGAFLAALHHPAPPTAPTNEYRGIPLRDRDESTRRRLSDLAGRVDTVSLVESWERALASPAYVGEPLWLHGDLHPLNILADGGRLTGVIDFGDITSGDPATDLAIAWILFDSPSRSRFRAVYGRADHDMWERARGWAISLGVALVANSADNPTLRGIGTTTLARLNT